MLREINILKRRITLGTPIFVYDYKIYHFALTKKVSI